MADFDFSTLITDRTQADLDALRALLSTPMADWTAEQLAEFNRAASKGAYNYTDLNRVTACMDYLNEVLTGLGYVTGYQRIVVHPDSGGATLPDGYVELEYIESTGTQRIDTGIKPDGNTRVTVDTQISDAQTTEGHLFSVTGNKYFVVSFKPQLTAWWRTRHGSSALTSFPASANTRGRCIVDKNQNITTVNEEIVTLPEADFSLNYNMNLFCRNASGKFNAFLSAKLYSCQIYDNGTLIRDYVPCTNPSGEVGLYDLENEEFYGNAGSGAFTAGPEVHPPEPPLDPYTWYEEDTPTLSQMQQYLANGAALRDALTMADDLPDLPPDMDELTQAEANDIEALLGTINDYLEAMQRIFLRSGMAWAISGGPNFYFVN